MKAARSQPVATRVPQPANGQAPAPSASGAPPWKPDTIHCYAAHAGRVWRWSGGLRWYDVDEHTCPRLLALYRAEAWSQPLATMLETAMREVGLIQPQEKAA